jgi:hypothetical protein
MIAKALWCEQCEQHHLPTAPCVPPEPEAEEVVNLLDGNVHGEFPPELAESLRLTILFGSGQLSPHD